MRTNATEAGSFHIFLASALLCALSAAPAAAQQELFVSTTSFEITGSTSRMGLLPPYTTVLDEYTIHSDAVVRRDGCHVFVLNRLFADNVLVLDACDGYRVVKQYSVSASGLNPHDIEVVAPDKAYLTLYEESALLIVDPLSGVAKGSIDLSAFADADGIPEMDQMVVLGDRLFVSLQHLDRNAGFSPAGGSMLVVIDTNTDTVIDADPVTPGIDGIDLQLEVPFWRMEFDPRSRRLLVGCSGSFGVLDGGLEAVNPFDLRSEGVWLSEQDLGGDLLDFAMAGPSLAYVLISEPDFDTCVLRADPSSGSVLGTLFCSIGFTLSDLELSSAGRLYVGDRTATAPGIRVFDAATGIPLAGPIDVGLPPFDMVLVEYLPSGTAPGNGAAPGLAQGPRLHAAPNPFNPAVEIRLKGFDAGAPPPRLRIVDARGRHLRALSGRRSGPDLLYRFDGRDEEGHQLASGTYFAIPLDGSAEPLAITLVR